MTFVTSKTLRNVFDGQDAEVTFWSTYLHNFFFGLSDLFLNHSWTHFRPTSFVVHHISLLPPSTAFRVNVRLFTWLTFLLRQHLTSSTYMKTFALNISPTFRPRQLWEVRIDTTSQLLQIPTPVHAKPVHRYWSSLGMSLPKELCGYQLHLEISPFSKYTAFSRTLGCAAVIHNGVRGSSRLSLKSSFVQSPTCEVCWAEFSAGEKDMFFRTANTTMRHKLSRKGIYTRAYLYIPSRLCAQRVVKNRKDPWLAGRAAG